VEIYLGVTSFGGFNTNKFVRIGIVSQLGSIVGNCNSLKTTAKGYKYSMKVDFQIPQLN